MRAPSVTPYGDAMRAIKAFCGDVSRNAAHLEQAAAALRGKSLREPKPSTRDEALRSAEAIELFQGAPNAFGLGALPLIEAPRFTPMHSHGTLVSVQPDLIVGTAYPNPNGKVGAAFIRPQKRPDPGDCKTDETKNERTEYRREMARYMLTLLRLQLLASGVPEAGLNPKWLFCLDLRLGERIEFPSDRVSREKRIRAACGQIARLWDTVEPRTGDLLTSE